MTTAEGTRELSKAKLTGAHIERIAHEHVPGISTSAHVRNSDLVFLSGQTSAPPVPVEFIDELDAAFRSLNDALTQAGAQWGDVVRITVYVVDLPGRQLADIRTVRDRWIDADHLPASSFIGVSALALPDLHVEIEAIAALATSH